ncbi:MAG: exopolyphosphatase, partial [Lachnospiraceae bacterium]|nr:exopolyphosphatase [Lachnospiraceae bacterium]
MIYSMYPEQNISAWIVNGKGGKGCSAAVGYSILNRTATLDVGSLMLKYGGGGHKAVGTCQFSDDNMDTELPKMLDELVSGVK